jgi:predicted metal-dependent phosphoesterase TrpH
MIIKADLHVHSKYSTLADSNSKHSLIGKIISDSVMEVSDILKKYHEKGIQVICISDHNNLEGYKIAKQINPYKDLLVIPGSEVSTKDGHMLCYGVDQVIPTGLPWQETATIIRQKGGLAIAAHPFGPLGIFYKKPASDLNMLDGLEVFWVLGSFDKTAKEVCEANNLISVVNTDSHVFYTIGATYSELDIDTFEVEGVINALKNKKINYKAKANASLFIWKVLVVLNALFGKFLFLKREDPGF